MARPKVVHIKSNTLNKKPTTDQIDYGEIAVNYNSGNTFLAVKDSKNDIKVFTDKTTNDASYAPKSDFNELKQGVINNEQTTSAALNDLNTRVNQLSSVDMGNYATTATTEVIKSDISGLKTSVGANETKISALEANLRSYVPTSRTINGTALTSNITITKVESATTSTNVNGYTVAKSVPSNAVFTDTTYDDVTTSTRGLMTAADKTKLDGIASGATKYSHPTFTAKKSGFYKIAVNNEGHVTGTTKVEKSDITGLIGGTPSLTGHNHDDRYYTESEVNTKLETINEKMVTGATMSSTATVPSVDSNVLTIPTVAGKPGTNAGFGTPTASVDSNTGIPAVTVTASGPNTAKVFAFEFKNLKGKDGTNGSDGTNGTSASITGATATVTTLDAGNDATVRVEKTGTEFSSGFKFTFRIPKGEKGDPGQTGPAGPSANATTNNSKRYLMGLSSTTGNITGATTSGSCYMLGGCLYSQNKEVLTAVTESNHYTPSTGSWQNSNAGGWNSTRPITDIQIDSKGHIRMVRKSESEFAYKSELNGYVPTGRTVNGKKLSQNITIDSVESATTAKSATTSVSATSIAWTGITGKPSEFEPSSHTHSEYVKKTGDTMSGTLHINSTSTALTCTGKTEFKGDVTVTGKVSASSGFFQTSDRRLKNFQGDIEVDFDKLKSIPKKYFYWNMDSKKSKLEIGTSAQEVMEVYPELVSINEAGMLSVAYDKLSVIALKAVDELHEENVALKEKNDELERRLKAIEEKLGI